MLPAPLPYNKESTKLKVNLCPLTVSRLLTSRFIRCCALFTEHVQATAAPGHSVEDSKALDCKIEAIGSEGPLAIEEQQRQNTRSESREEDFSMRGIIAKPGDDASKQQVALVQQAAAEPAGEHVVGKSMDEPAEPDEHRSGRGAAEDNGDDKPGQQGAPQNHDNDMDGQQEAAQDGEAAQQQDAEQKNGAGEEEEDDDDEDLYSSRPPAQPHDDNVSTQQGADADGRSSAAAADDKSQKSVEVVVVENSAGPDDANKSKEVVEHDDAKSKKSVEDCALPAGDLALQRVDMVGSPTTKTKMQNFFRVLVAPQALVKGHQSDRL